jgi:hypothetical protein
MQLVHSHNGLHRAIAFAACCLLPAACCFLAGCDATDPMEDMYNKPSPALSDPMNYSPDMDRTDVSGGSTTNYNDKAMKEDLNELLNP